MKTLQGVIDMYAETGTEGVIWMFYEHNFSGYDAMRNLDKGDHLKIFDGDKVLFDGVIEPDYKIGYQPYPMNPKYGQQVALGYWIHWVQKGYQPDDWAKLFIRKEPLKATLVKK